MQRHSFLRGLSSAALLLATTTAASATGGLNLDDPTSQNVALRVFLSRQEGRRYRGQLGSVSLPDGREGLLNSLSLEEYLYGVVPLEMPSSWPYAALEAQAIFARTFAMKRRNPNRAYDLVAGSADQEYGGINAESQLSNQAIDASAGLIVLYDGMPANSPYMACCGGHTDDAGRVWGTSYPYLSGVDDPYCADAPSRNWSVRVPWASIARSAGMNQASAPRQAILDDLSLGGRPGAIRFIGNGSEGRITTTQLRAASGWRLPSTFIRAVAIERQGQVDMPPPTPHDGNDGNDDLGTGPTDAGDGANVTLVFQGSGSGHGVGLCQWGARGMARAGATGQEIVAHYLPATRLGALSPNG